MKEINQYSKKGKKWLANYWGAQYSELYQIYNTYSHSKELGMQDCKLKCRKENGENLRIISWNQMKFTVGWISGKNLRIETANNSYKIKGIIKEL